MKWGNGRWVTAAIGALCALAVAACGSSSKTSSSSSSSAAASSSSSSDPRALLDQAFQSTTKVRSGVLNFQLTVTPTGSSSITQPVTMSMSGPFATSGNKLSEADLTINASVLGKHASFGIVSVNGATYARLQGETYRIPSSQSSQANQLGSLGSLQALGVDPKTWFTNPTDAGTETVDGVEAEHIKATVDVDAMLEGINKVIAKESSSMGSQTGRTIPQLSPAERQKIAAKIQNPTVDVWVGKSDSIVRRFGLHLNVPITGQLSTKLGGMTAAGFALTTGYSKVNQPQNVTAPANPRSFAQLQAKLQTILPQLEGAFGGLGGAGSGGTGSTGSTSSGAGGTSAAKLQKFSACLKKAEASGDTSRIQKCQQILQGGQ